MDNKNITKCSFCVYRTSSGGCMAVPNSKYCSNAKQEYYNWLYKIKQQPVKSLRPWEKKK